MKFKTLRHAQIFEASCSEIFDLLLDISKISKWFGDGTISKEEDTYFELGNTIFGRNNRIIPGILIEQDWRVVHPEWPTNHYSYLQIILQEDHSNTILHLIQEKIPEKCFYDIDAGWNEYYWKRMRAVIRGEIIPENELIGATV